MSQFWGGGIVGGITGPEILTDPFASLSGQAFFLDNSADLASDSNDGSELRPFSTLAHAVSEASAEDIIVVGATHNEIISTTVTINKAGLTIVGEETGIQMPRFTNGMASQHMIEVDANLVSFWSVRFGASSATGAARKVRIDTSGDFVFFHGCRVDQGANDTAITGIGIAETTTAARFEACIFTSVGRSSGGVAPAAAITVDDDTSGLELTNCVFDGSIYGWGLYALDASLVAATHTRMRRVQLLRGSIAIFGAGSTYQFFKAFSDDGGNAIITS